MGIILLVSSAYYVYGVACGQVVGMLAQMQMLGV